MEPLYKKKKTSRPHSTHVRLDKVRFVFTSKFLNFGWKEDFSLTKSTLFVGLHIECK